MLSLKEWRRARGVSQQSVADHVGCHVNTIIKWEENPSRIPYGTAKKIADFIGVPFEDIDFLSEKSTKSVETTG